MRNSEIAADFRALTDTDLDLVEGALIDANRNRGHKGYGGASAIDPAPGGIADAVQGIWSSVMA